MTPVGMWRAVARGARVFLPALLGLVAVQVLLLLSNPVPALNWGFVALTVGSLLAVVLATTLSASAAVAAVSGGPSGIRTVPAVFGWALLTGLLTAVVAVAELPLTPVVLLLAIPGLPALAAGQPVMTGYRRIARLPWHYLFAALLTVALMVLSWALALVLGVFLTGLLAAAALWLWLGVCLIVLLCLFSSLYRRAAGDPVGYRSDTQPV